MSTKAKHNRTTPNIKAACEECRIRKTKCDGGRPACSRCVKKDKHCEYDAEPDEHRSATLKRKCKVFEQRALAGERLLAAMQDLPEGEAVSILQRLRAQEGIETVAASLAEHSSRDTDDRETSPSIAGSYSSAGSAAASSAMFEDSSRSHDADRRIEGHNEDAEMSGRSTADQRLAISFLVDNAAGSRSSTSQQQLPMSTSSADAQFNPPILRTASYPPVTAAANETDRRASAPISLKVAGAQAIKLVAEAEQSRPPIPPSPGVMQDAGPLPDPESDWDQYFTNVSSLLRRIGEGRGGRQ